MINTGCLAYHSEAAMSFCFAKTRRENPLLTIEHSASKMHIWIFASQKQGGKSSPHHKVRIFVSQKQGGKSSPHHKVRIFASQKQGGCYEV